MKTQQEELNTVSGELEGSLAGNFEDDVREYNAKKYDYIPLSPKLIDHVRRLDSLNVSALPEFIISVSLCLFPDLSMSFSDLFVFSTMNFRS